MFIFAKPFNQKSTALILTICIIIVSVAPCLLYPQQAKSSQFTDWVHIALQVVIQAIRYVYQKAMEYYEKLQTAIAQWMQSKKIIEWAKGALLNILLHQILAKLTNDIVNWIQNGTEPRFLTMGLGNWLSMAADNALGDFVNQYLGIGWLCEPFDAEIKIAMQKQTTFKEEAKCSISDMVNNIEDFYNDFSVGGWGGWIKLTEGGNNVYSAYLIALEEKNRIIGNEEKEQEAEIARGNGFFSPKDCIWFDANSNPINLEVDSDTGRRYTSGYKDVWGTASLPDECQPSNTGVPFETQGGIQGPCTKKCISHTPGKQISDTASKTMNRFWDTLNAQITAASTKSGPLSIYSQAILTALINRVFDEGYGLLFAENEDVPEAGDLGIGTSTENVLDPTEIAQDKIAVGLIEVKLSALEEGLDELLIEQKTNLGILDEILAKYRLISATIDQILDPAYNCDDDTKSWARAQKSTVDAKILEVGGDITTLEDEIEETESVINRISTIIVPAIADYYEKYDAYEAAYEAAGGICDPDDPDDPVTVAITALSVVQEELIEEIQLMLTEINGSYTGTTLPELQTEVSDTYTNIKTVLIPALKTERGDRTTPASGTLYARLEEAEALKELALEKLGTCS